ncbi:substrate-binding periplasmic protein [Zooshikella sp. RANM57]|uniref:substrate-binding periplasmic protein n=1 Tax=Zooshikella sp. RANM57 TaxID=3425863 RepID=UPI003D6E6F69
MSTHWLSIVLFLLTTSIGSAAETDKPNTISFCYIPKANFPFVLNTQDEPIVTSHPGISIQIIRHLAQKYHFKVIHVRSPWKRCLMQLKQNSVDASFHSVYQAKRLEFGVYPFKNGHIDVSRKMISNSYHLFKLKDASVTWNGHSFQNLNGPLGATLGFSIVDTLNEMGIDVVEDFSLERLLLRVKKEHLAGFIGFYTIAKPLLEEDDRFKDIVMEPIPIETIPMYLMFSKQMQINYPTFVEQLWNELSVIHEQGLYRQWMQSYFDYDACSDPDSVSKCVKQAGEH